MNLKDLQLCNIFLWKSYAI